MKICAQSWNAALDQAAKLIGERGYTYVRRNLDLKTLTVKIDIYHGEPKVKGDYEESTHCGPDEMACAAILSLRKTK